MEEDEKFNEIYNELLKLNIDELEILKKESKKENGHVENIAVIGIIISIILIPCMFFIYAIGIVSISVCRNLTIILIGITCISIGVKMANATEYKKYNEYRGAFKEKVIKPMVSSFNKKLNYIFNSGINRYDYEDSNFEKFDIYSSEDSIEGNINNIELKMGEVLAEKTKYDRNYGTREYEIFQGLFAKIKIPKQFNTEIYIRRKYQDNLKNMKIEINDEEFNRYFYVYSSNNVEASQVLTQNLIEILLNFRKISNIGFDITLKNNYIYIRLHTGEIKKQSTMSYRNRNGSLFEPPNLNKEVLNKEEIYINYKILYSSFDLINKIVKEINR